MQLTEVQLGRAGAEAEAAEASSSPSCPQSPAHDPQPGSALREVVSCGIQPTSTQRANQGPSSRRLSRPRHQGKTKRVGYFMRGET